VIKSGEVLWQGHNLLKMSADKRARLGMFLAFQYPMAIPGLSVASFLRSAINARRAGLTPDPEIDPTDAFRGGIPMGEFRKLVREKMALLKMDESIASRYVNEGFSGGEKKRNEILQMSVLEPRLAVLDETDSGLDIDALREVAAAVQALRDPSRAMVVITHHQRLLDYLVPDRVHVLAGGTIVASGDKSLAVELEQHGYGRAGAKAPLREEVA
jgi:Fe-S cluster assembly ATP-binding protein